MVAHPLRPVVRIVVGAGMTDDLTARCRACRAPIEGDAQSCTACGVSESPPSFGSLRDLRRLGALALICALVLGWWLVFFRDAVPGFATVPDFKASAATLVVVLVGTQVLTASVFYGWVRTPWPSREAAAFVHRWSGRVLVPTATVVSAYCLKDIGPQSTPVRAAVHTVLAAVMTVALVGKLVILRAVPRLSRLVPVLGVTVAIAFVGIWLTSAFYVVRAGVQNYAAAPGSTPPRLQTEYASATPDIDRREGNDTHADPHPLRRHGPGNVRDIHCVLGCLAGAGAQSER